LRFFCGFGWTPRNGLTYLINKLYKGVPLWLGMVERTDDPNSDLWPCPDCGGTLKEQCGGLRGIDYWLNCDRCGWDKQLARSVHPSGTRRSKTYLEHAQITSERMHG